MSKGMLVVIGVVVLVVVILVGLSIRGRRIQSRLRENYPPPGEMVGVGGYRMHLNCQGKPGGAGQPTVILEAAEFSSTWATVQPAVAKFAKVCSYDRAGLGWSERGSRPRSVAIIVDELHMLLEKGDVAPPYVLVGHSKGGMYVRSFAHTFPYEVVGMVLVDAAHEEQEARFPAVVTELNQKGRKQTVGLMGLIQRLNRFGTLTPLLKLASDQLMGTVPEQARKMSLPVVLSNRFLDTVVEETENLEDQFEEVRGEEIHSLGEMPLVVLTAVDQFAGLEGQVSPEDMEALKDVVGELQEELAGLSSNGKVVRVKESGHFIQVDRPEIVVEAIREVVEAVGIR